MSRIILMTLLMVAAQIVSAEWVDKKVQALLDERAASTTANASFTAESLRKKFHFEPAADLSLVEVVEKTITLDSKAIPLTIVRPKGESNVLPVFLFFHGGGWVFGNFRTHDRLVRDLVVGAHAVAVFVDYPLSPEARYPEAIQVAYAATQWVAENGKALNVDSTRLAVVGDSAGGNIAAAVCLMAKEKATPHITYQVLLFPVMDANFETTSYRKFANSSLTKKKMQWYWEQYIPDLAQRQEIYASPLKATSHQLKGLPPTLIQTAENDVLRDEGEAYAEKLNAAGVEVLAVRYSGMIHDFIMLDELSGVPAFQAAIEQVSEQLKKHLSA